VSTEPDPGEVAAFHAFAALPPEVQIRAKMDACLARHVEYPFGYWDLDHTTRHHIQAGAVAMFYGMRRAGTQATP
jgi:hypothetical protein